MYVSLLTSLEEPNLGAYFDEAARSWNGGIPEFLGWSTLLEDQDDLDDVDDSLESAEEIHCVPQLSVCWSLDRQKNAMTTILAKTSAMMAQI